MSESSDAEFFLSEAGEREKEYDWLGAAEFCEKAIELVSETDFLKTGEVHEKIGHCFHRASFQAGSQEEFRERVRRAVEAYEKAGELYEKLAGERKARSLRSRAVAKYLGFWLTSDPSERRSSLDECLELASKAMDIFSESRDMHEYVRTYSALAPYEYSVFSLRWIPEPDRQAIEKAVEKGFRWGEKAVAALREINDPDSGKAYLNLAVCLITHTWFVISDPEIQEQYRERAHRYINKVVDLSEEAGDYNLLGQAYFWLGDNFTEGDESIRCFGKMLECAEKTRDNFLEAFALSFLTYEFYWKAIETEDPDQRLKLSEEAMRYYDKSEQLFPIFSFICPRGGLIPPPSGHAEHYFYLAEWETDPEKKLDFLRESEKNGLEALKVAENSEVPIAIIYTHYVLGNTLTARGRLEPDLDEKKSLLGKALRHLERSVGIQMQWKPFVYWNIGAFYNRLADTKAEMAYLESDLKTKRMLLEEAASNKEKCIELISKRIPSYEKRGKVVPYTSIYGYQDTYWRLLNHLYKLTNNPEYLRKAIEITQKAMETAIRLDMASLRAESHWKIAKAQDTLQEYLPAAENFEHASRSYSKAAKGIPKLKDLYQDYASYMQAWSEIEKAKHHHERQESGSAKEHFEKAANVQKSLRKWSYLAPNYFALAQIENAEDLSRKEQSEEALTAFKEAIKLFNESKKSLETKLTEIVDLDEKIMATSLIKASDSRREYCLGRVALEEAKILDTKGDHYSSSQKYNSAAQTFEKILRSLETEQDQKEFKLIITLSRAWQKMTLAEAESSSALYLEASQLFQQAKEFGPNEKTKMLVLGHSRFCKALEAGTKFTDSRDTTIHVAAVQHLASAASYYVKADFRNASEYAQATRLLLDAYLHMDNAEKETAPEKKTRLYAMAEKVLQSSAGAYMKARHPEKREQVLRLLEEVRKDRELAVSLTEVLHAPSIVSATTSFLTPTPTHEEAVGLERFEHANIQAHLTASEQVVVGEELEIQLDLVNVARNFGLLVRAENVVPSGFKAVKLPEQYELLNGSLNLRGKRLDPLKVETLKISIEAIDTGTVYLCPKVVYTDETGNFRVCRSEAIQVNVHPPLIFKFKTDAAKMVFDCLIQAFVEDYMKRKLVIQEAGWRSLVQIAKNSGVSLRSVYGTAKRRGSAISELERRGLIETGIFSGKRGRGGKITKLRISYAKETIKRYIDAKVARGPEPKTIKVLEAVLPGRVATGCLDLDNLLYGGLPENYAVVLTSPSSDERDLLIRKFLETGVKDGRIAFYVTIEASGVRALVEEFQSHFYLFICNPRADTMVKSLPNVFKLKGVENLTDIDIALMSAFRGLDASPKNGPRRACFEIVSDVLLQHHAVNTRRWLTGLIQDLRSRGFTTLAVMNPYMHSSEEVHAILGLFDGEINIYEKETTKGLEKFIKVKKMYNQRYLENELPLRKERLEK